MGTAPHALYTLLPRAADYLPLTSHIRALREVHGDEEADEVYAEIQLDLADGAKRQQTALFGAVPTIGVGVPGAVDDSGVSGNAAGDAGGDGGVA